MAWKIDAFDTRRATTQNGKGAQAHYVRVYPDKETAMRQAKHAVEGLGYDNCEVKEV